MFTNGQVGTGCAAGIMLFIHLFMLYQRHDITEDSSPTNMCNTSAKTIVIDKDKLEK